MQRDTRRRAVQNSGKDSGQIFAVLTRPEPFCSIFLRNSRGIGTRSNIAKTSSMVGTTRKWRVEIPQRMKCLERSNPENEMLGEE
ncbi:hypothetical protein ACFX2G_030841 [Malus domestica]